MGKLICWFDQLIIGLCRFDSLGSNSPQDKHNLPRGIDFYESSIHILLASDGTNSKHFGLISKCSKKGTSIDWKILILPLCFSVWIVLMYVS